MFSRFQWRPFRACGKAVSFGIGLHSKCILCFVKYKNLTILVKSTLFMFYKNCLLIATPDMEGSIFDRSVILMCEHDENGAMGLIINKESSISVKELAGMFPLIAKQKKNFLTGGPVNQDEVWVLHDLVSASDVRKTVNEHLYLTSNPSFLKSISKAQLDFQFIQFFLGYSGWAAGQLESEIARGSWITSPYNHEIVCKLPLEKRWSRALYLLGEDYACIAHKPKNADMN